MQYDTFTNFLNNTKRKIDLLVEEENFKNKNMAGIAMKFKALSTAIGIIMDEQENFMHTTKGQRMLENTLSSVGGNMAIPRLLNH